MAYDNFSALNERQNLINKVDQQLEIRGLTDFGLKKRRYQDSATQLGNYLSGGQYTSADNQTYREQTTKAIADLDEQLKTYTKSSDEYKTLDSYRNYYQTALNDFDRMDVVMSTGDYVGADAWHSSEDYTAQKTALQSSIDQLGAEMDAMEDKNSADYQRLKGYYDRYTEAMTGLDERNKWDSQFESADDYVLFQNSQDYKNTVQLQKQIAQAQARLDEITPTLELQSAGGDLNNVDMELYAEAAELRQSIAEWQKDLGKMEQWQGSIALNNFGDFNPSTDYQALVDELKTAKQGAKTEEEAAQIDMQLRVLAGANYDGTNGNGLFDKSNYLGRQQMRGFKIEDAQKRIDEIDEELASYHLTELELAAQSAGSGAAAPGRTLTPEGQKHVEELQSERRDLQKKLFSAETGQAAEKAADDFHKLPAERAAQLKEEALKHMTDRGYEQKDYDPTKSTGEADLKNFEYILGDDEDTAEILEQMQVDPQLADMFYAAIGAEWLGEDIGFTVQDLLDAYGADMAQIAGYKQAKKIDSIESDFKRWNRQVFGVGTAAGLNQFWTGMRQFFTDDYIAPNATAARGAYTRANLSRYGDEQILPGSSQGGSNLSQLMFDTVQTTANMLPMIAVSYLTKGALAGVGVAAGAAATAGEIAGAVTMSMSSAGNSYQQALSEGWSKDDAKVFSIITGAAEGGLQYLLGGISGLGGVTEEGILAAARGMNNAAVRIATETGVHIASETTEELLQNRIERYLRYSLMGEGDGNWMAWDDDDWYTVIITALSTGAMEGPGTVVNVARDTEIGKIASGQKTIPIKQAFTRYGQLRQIAGDVGGYIKSDKALTYTLEALSEQMGEGTDTYKLEQKIQKSGKSPSAMQLGALFSSYLAENSDTKEGAKAAFVSLVGGALAYHGIQKQKAAQNAAETRHAEMVKANPEATVLDQTAGELTKLGITDASIALEYSAAINKVLNGQTPTNAEMTKLVGRSDAAKASRVILSQRNPALTEHLDAVGMKEAINQIASDIDTIKKQQAGLTKASVVQAALDAVEQMKVNDATRGAKLNPEKMQQAAEDLQKSQTEIDTTKAKIKALETMGFKELAAINDEFIAGAAGVETVAAFRDLKQQLGKLNERANELQKNKFPSKAERAELVQIRQQQNQIKRQMVDLDRQATESIKAAAKEAEAAGKAEGKAAPNTSAEAPAAGDYFVDPTGQVRTREDYIATKTAQGMTEEEANAEFDRDAEMAGGVKHGQATDNAGTGEDALGRRGESGEDRQRGDRSVRPGEQGANGKRHPIRPQTDGLGQRKESVDDSAVVTDSKSVSSLGEEYSWLEDLTDRLTQSGFQYINYITKGGLYNKAGQPVPALCIGREMFLVVDSGSRGFVDAIARHEDLHMRLNLLKAQYGDTYRHMFVTGALQKLMTTEEYIAAYRKYSDGDENNPGGYGRAYEDVEQEERIHMINEEILCDMVAGLETFKDFDMGKYQEGAWQFLSESNFDEVTERLANPDLGAPGELISADDLGVFPHNVPKDTLLSDKNVDAPSTEVASIQDVSQSAFYGLLKSLGFYSDGESKVYYRTKEDAEARRNGFTDVNVDDVANSPIGDLIEYCLYEGIIDEESAARQLQLFADIGTIADQTNDFYLAMQFYGSAIFTAMKLNSDTQYGTSEDVANICTKTQNVINGMSEAMKTLKRGLKDSEILEIYQRYAAAKMPVNCPECYVFSRWIGIGGLLDNINYYQNTYGSMTPEEVAALYVKNAAKVEKAAEAAGINFGKQKSKMATKLQEKYNKLVEDREKAEQKGQTVTKKALDQEAALKREMADIRSLSWIADVYFGGKAHTAQNVNPNYYVPADVLFDLNAGEEFASKYKEAWAYRTTQGAGYGKAITPTAEAHIGESILTTKNTSYIKGKADAAGKYKGDSELERHEAGVAKNIFYTQRGPIRGDKKNSRGDALIKTRQKEFNQLFLGGQRLQSTSDARYDTAIDSLLIALEMQAMKAGEQIYTKVLGAVPFYASTGGFVNMSAMPFGHGLDKNSNPIDTPYGGVDMEKAKDLRRQHPTAGTITIGVNDAHIRAMFDQVFRDFIIPYHASGGKTAIVAEMRRIQEGIEAGKYKMPKSTDYTKTQSDKFLSDTILEKDLHLTKEQIDEVHRFRETRIYLLTGGKYGTRHADILEPVVEAPSADPRERALQNAKQILRDLDASLREGGRWTRVDTDKDGNTHTYRVQLAKGKIEGQIFPNEFWDTSVDYKDSGVNTQRYLDYCTALGVLHRFSGKGVKTGKVQGETGLRGHIYTVKGTNGLDPNGEEILLTDLAFKNGVDGEIEDFFWKLLVDRRMYDNEGHYLEQKPVTLDAIVGMTNPEPSARAEAVAKGVESIVSKEKGFAHATGELRYEHKASMDMAKKIAKDMAERNGTARSALAMTAPGYQTTDEKAITDDLGQKLYVTPSNGGWGVETDPTNGALLNTDYLIDDLGLKIYRNPIDEYFVQQRGVKGEGGKAHPTANFSTRPTYEQAYQYVREQQAEGKMPENVRILDASSGRGHGASMGKEIFGEDNVMDLEPFDPSRDRDYDKYGGLIAAIDAGEAEGFDFVISNAVINVMAQDAREQLMAALLRMVKPGGQIFINPADTGEGHRRTLTLGEYHDALDAGEDLTDVNVLLVPATKTIGREQYVAPRGKDEMGSIQKAFKGREFQAFAKDVAKQALGEDIRVESGSSTPMKKGFIITREAPAITRNSLALSPEQQANVDFNNRQTEVGSGLKTLSGKTPMTRSKTKVDGVPANVGKQMGDKIWVHKNYAERVVPKAELNRAESVLREKFPNFQYNTIMYDKKTGNIRFDEAPNFDTAREPIPGGMVTVMPNGDTKVGYSDNIWHHKWMWVDNDYKGFDVADSWNWSKQWLSTLQEVANGSTRGPSGWNLQMDKYGLPTDPASDVEIKDRKAEIARIEGKPVKGTIPARSSLASNEETALIIKNDTKRGVDFVEKMLDGEKLGETRTNTNSIKPGVWYGLSNGGKNSQVVGRVKFGEPIKISNDPNSEYYNKELYDAAMIEGTDYDLTKPGEWKYYYPVEEIEDLRNNPAPVTKTWPGHGAYVIPSKASLTKAQPKVYNEARSSQAMPRSENYGRTENDDTRRKLAVAHRLNQFLQEEHWTRAYFDAARKPNSGVEPKTVWRTDERRQQRVVRFAADFFKDHHFAGWRIDHVEKPGTTTGEKLFEYGTIDFLDWYFDTLAEDPNKLAQSLVDHMSEGDAEDLIKGLNKAMVEPREPEFAHRTFNAKDQEYMEAIENNDIAKLRKMVNDAAEDAGYVRSFWQHTPSYFDEFDRGEFGFHLGSFTQAAHLIRNKLTSQWNHGTKGLPHYFINLYSSIENPYILPQIEDWNGVWKNDYNNWTSSFIAEQLLLDTEEFSDPRERAILKKISKGDAKDDFDSPERRAITNILEAHKFDALNYTNTVEGNKSRDSGEAYILWDPSKLKSSDLITYDRDGKIIPLSERFDEQDDRFRYAMASAEYNSWAPEFYSKMENTIKEWTNGKGQPLGAKMAANQVVGWLKGKGVKSEEIKWSGIIPYLEGKKAVTRDELLGVMAENEIDIDIKTLDSGTGKLVFWSDRDWDEVKVDGPEELMEYAEWLAEEEGFNPDDLKMYPGNDGYYITRDDTGEIFVDASEDKVGDTHWSEYRTEDAGGYNYREILFRMPNLGYTNRAMQAHWGNREEYNGGPDAQNIIAHARVQDLFTGWGSGIPTIFVEEIQSDLHNQGVMKPGPSNTPGTTKEHAPAGFATTKAQREYQEMTEILEHRDFTEEEERKYEKLRTQMDTSAVKEAQARYQEAMENRKPYEAVAEEITSAIEANDMVQQLKHFFGRLRHNDILEWVTGRTHKSDSFDSNTPADVMLDQIKAQDRQDATARLLEESVPENMRGKLEEVRAAYRAVAEASEDLVIANRNLSMAPPDVPFAGSADTYHEFVMKHLLRLAAEGGYGRIAWTPAYMQSERWSDEFREGYEIEYDQKIPKFMNKYVKQWGSKVETATLDNGKQVYSVDVTPEMKQSVLETGQPLFSLANPAKDPEHQLFDDLLGVAQSGDPDLIADWVHAQLDKSEQAKEAQRLRPPVIPRRDFVPRVTDSENAVLDQAIAGLIKRNGAHRPSEKNANGLLIPKKNAKKQNISRAVQNIGSAEQVDAYVKEIKRFSITDEAATYMPTSNAEQIEHAKEVIKEDGFDTAFKQFDRYVNDPTIGFRQWGQQLHSMIALGQQLLIEAAVNNDVRKVLDLTTDLTMLESEAGKSLQAARLLKMSGPIGELMYAQKVVDKLNKQYKKMIEGGRLPKITIGKEFSDAVVNAPTREAREEALKELKLHIAGQLPVSPMDRWNAWRYLSMLGNLRTHIRNVLGNAIFVPMRFTKDLMSAGGEFILTKAGIMDETDRTKAARVNKEYLAFAQEDAEVMKQELQGNGKYNPVNELMAARKVLPGVLDKINRINSDGIGEGYGIFSKLLVGLEGEDWAFLAPAYSKALAMTLMHSGYTVEQLQGEGGPDAAKALNKARAIALEEAQRATYRDFSVAAASLNRLKKSGGIGGLLVEGVLPFTKTPINILRRGLEYSPAGILESIVTAAKEAKTEGSVDWARFIDRLSAGFTGTGVMILGWLLSRMGWLRGKKDDEKEENFDKLQGYQDYSLQIGDLSMTIDWAAPGALPLFVGAAVDEALSGDGRLTLTDAWDAMMMITEPMLSLSMLEGLNNMISSASYARGNQKVMTIAGSAIQSYLGQAFPTLLGQLARSIDGTRRSTYVDKNSGVPTGIQRFVQSSIQNKIPGWESQKTPYVDAWGREDTVSSKFLGALENFLSPSYINMVKSTDVDDELTRLHSALTDAEAKKYVLPAVPTKKIGDKDLSADEYVALAKDVGSTKYTLLSQLIYDPRYLALSDEDKAKAIKKIYDYSTAAGRYHVVDTYDIRRQGVWIAEAEAMPTMAQTYERIWEAILKALES